MNITFLLCLSPLSVALCLERRSCKAFFVAECWLTDDASLLCRRSDFHLEALWFLTNADEGASWPSSQTNGWWYTTFLFRRTTTRRIKVRIIIQCRHSSLLYATNGGTRNEQWSIVRYDGQEGILLITRELSWLDVCLFVCLCDAIVMNALCGNCRPNNILWWCPMVGQTKSVTPWATLVEMDQNHVSSEKHPVFSFAELWKNVRVNHLWKVDVAKIKPLICTCCHKKNIYCNFEIKLVNHSFC